MRKICVLVVVAIAATFIFQSCKYEEGPALSCRSKTARVVNIWKVLLALDNAVDVTDDYQAIHKNQTIEFTEGGDYIETFTDAYNNVQTYAGTWAFGSKKETIDVTFAGVTISYTILRLKNDELWTKYQITSGGATSTREYHYITN